MPTAIRKALISEFGDVSKVNIVESQIEDPTTNHVQVKIIYSGFSGSDINMRLGRYPMQKKAPLTPGYCFVGTVNQNGPSSRKFARGDLVGCLSIYDAEAELANVPEKYLIPVPTGLDLAQATALILDWNTAFGAIKAARISKGSKVFVHGMSGAVGYGLMVLCQLRGAEVYGTASERNHAALRELGATPFVYTNKDWIRHMNNRGGVQAVFDPLGFESWEESYSILSSAGGALIGYGGNLASLTGKDTEKGVLVPTLKLLSHNLKIWSKKRTVFHYITRDDKDFTSNLTEMFHMVKDGKITVPIKKVFPLEQVKDAHEYWGHGAGMGSMLIKVSEEPNA